MIIWIGSIPNGIHPNLKNAQNAAWYYKKKLFKWKKLNLAKKL